MLLLWTVSCHFTPTPVVPLTTSLLEVVSALDEAVACVAAGDPRAAAAWGRGHDRFEGSIEPFLRREHPPVEVARTEYAFGKIRALLDQGRDPRPEIEALTHRLEVQIAALP